MDEKVVFKEKECGMNDIKLSHGEKLSIIETDTETFYEFALERGFSKAQMRRCFSPILGEIDHSTRSSESLYNKYFISLIFFLVLSLCFYTRLLSYDMMAIHGRILLVKIFIYWDWSELYYRDCVFYNPFYQAVDRSSDENICKICKSFKKIERFGNIKASKVDEHIYSHNPFIVTDAIKGWPKDEDKNLLFSYERVKKLFREYPEITDEDEDCLFYSSVPKVNGLGEFVEELEENSLPDNFHIAWENCNTEVAKIYRKLAARPYFFPSYTECTKRNQLIIANGRYDGELFELPQQTASATWIILLKHEYYEIFQLEGEMKISLAPVEHCRSCINHYLSLAPGEGVLVPSSVWNLKYTPISTNTTLAYASTLVWDAID